MKEYYCNQCHDTHYERTIMYKAHYAFRNVSERTQESAEELREDLRSLNEEYKK